MILAIDAGNTTIQGGLFEQDRIVFQFRKTTAVSSSSDEFGVFFRSVLRENGFDYAAVRDIVCCSVVPSMNHSLSSAFKKYFSLDALFIQAGIKTGLKLKYANPREIGADRIAASIGAVALYPGRDMIVIDMGTATTVDVVTREREYLGGAILPGLGISVNALSGGTEKLPAVEIVRPEKVCGSSTVEAIQSGLYYGHAGAIREICAVLERDVFAGRKPRVIGTGGFSSLFDSCGIFDEIVPGLVLSGANAALKMNRP